MSMGWNTNALNKPRGARSPWMGVMRFVMRQATTSRYGESLIEWGIFRRLVKSQMATIRKVDGQGRVALPSRWRAKALGGSDEVFLLEREGDGLLVLPRRRVDLTAYFDSVEVDVDSSTFADYSKLKKRLVSRGEKS